VQILQRICFSVITCWR